MSRLENTVPKNAEDKERLQQEIATLRNKKRFLISNPSVLVRTKKIGRINGKKARKIYGAKDHTESVQPLELQKQSIPSHNNIVQDSKKKREDVSSLVKDEISTNECSWQQGPLDKDDLLPLVHLLARRRSRFDYPLCPANRVAHTSQTTDWKCTNLPAIQQTPSPSVPLEVNHLALVPTLEPLCVLQLPSERFHENVHPLSLSGVHTYIKTKSLLDIGNGK